MTTTTTREQGAAMASYIKHEDPGHGWLQVEMSELVRLNLQNRITRYSYCDGDRVYLEEDCDMSLFLLTKEKQGEKFVIVYRHTDGDHKIRNMMSY